MSIELRYACLVAVLAGSFGCSESPLREPAVIASELASALQHDADAAAIITLREPRLSEPAERKALVDEISTSVIANLGTTLQLSRRYDRTGALSGRITPQALEVLRQDPNVEYVQLVRGIRGQLRESVPAVGADRVRRSFGLTGRGVRVAVLDSGLATAHPDLQGATVAQHCFTQNACAPFNLREGTDATDGHGHGTAVTGVIGSRGVQGPAGFAPDAELVVLKVMNSENRGNDDDIVAALDWLAQNQAELHVDIVNMSLGTDALFDDAAECDRRSPVLARAIKNLRAMGVSVISASGNSGSSTQLTAPGCFTGVLTAGATYDADVGAAPPSSDSFRSAIDQSFAACRDATTQAGQIACYTNTAARVDVLAPGGPMLTLSREGGTTTRWGTSFAAAALSGVAAMLKQCNPKLDPDRLAAALTSTGEQHMDPRSGRSFPFIRVPEAVKVACPDLVVDAGTQQPPAQQPAEDGAASTPPPAADAGQQPMMTTTAPAQKPPRDPGKVQGAYTGRPPAEPLTTRPARAGSGADLGDAGTRKPASDGGELHTERVSSCAVQPGATGGTLGWLYALAAIGFALRRRRR
ncbi:MAG TPA: S8 family serine peptidase [Polyangiales bacterium]|nr:S8 family serine peptidase [Polyangiales bacterium]